MLKRRRGEVETKILGKGGSSDSEDDNEVAYHYVANHFAFYLNSRQSNFCIFDIGSSFSATTSLLLAVFYCSNTFFSQDSSKGASFVGDIINFKR